MSDDSVPKQSTNADPHADADSPPVDTTAADSAEKKDVLITPDGQELDLGILGTAKIDPEGSSPVKNPNRLNALKYGIAGLIYVLVREQSIQLATGATIIVVIVGIWLGVNAIGWALLVLALGAVWITECLNTAIEASINLGTSDPHPMAKVGKDVAAAASLIASLVFILIVLLILVPRVLDRLSA